MYLQQYKSHISQYCKSYQLYRGNSCDCDLRLRYVVANSNCSYWLQVYLWLHRGCTTYLTTRDRAQLFICNANVILETFNWIVAYGDRSCGGLLLHSASNCDWFFTYCWSPMINITSATRWATREMILPSRDGFYGFDAQNSLVAAKHNTTLACTYFRVTRWLMCMHIAQWIARRIAKVKLGSTPAICLAMALRQPGGNFFRSESLNCVSWCASRHRSDIVHWA